MKYSLILALLFTLINCGKSNNTPPTSTNKNFWKDEAWEHFDDDADGVNNADELKLGTHPELINPPNLSGFALSNVIFYQKEIRSQLNPKPFHFVIDNRPINRFFYSVLSPLSKKGQIPFQSYQFQHEHASIQTSSSYLMPNVFLLRPKIDPAYLEFLKENFYDKHVFKDTTLSINCSLTLNFPANLNQEKWTKIEGEFKWGDKTIPWKWNKDQTSQTNWQITLDAKDWLSVIQDQQPLVLTIHNWEISTPAGNRSFNETSLAKLTPFYIINSKGSESGWYNTQYPLPAESIVNRPTENNYIRPWYFLRLENITESSNSYWLKELSDEELELFENGKSLQWSKHRMQDDLAYLPLPPHSIIRGLKMKISSQKYTYSINQNPINTPTGKLKCYSSYPKFSEKMTTSTQTNINLERFLKGIMINRTPLRELINSQFYLTFEYAKNNQISALILNWSDKFKWIEFSIAGLNNEKNTIRLNSVCTSLVDSSDKYWPIYKEEQLNFEWLY